MRNTLLSILSLIVILTSTAVSADELTKAPIAENGELDLRSWDFNKNGPVALAGEWEFYWQRLISPQEFESDDTPSPKYSYAPSIWNIADKGNPQLDRHGYATYRLHVTISDTEKLYALKTDELFTAYRIWINGKEIFSSGTVGTDRKSTTPRIKPDLTLFQPDTNRLDIVLQLANFHYKDGGMRSAIQLGTGTQMSSNRTKSMFFNFSLFGALLIMGFYHLILFLLRKEDLSPLFFGFYCILNGVRVLVTQESVLLEFIPAMSWDIRTKIIVLEYFLAVPVFMAFLYTLFPKDLHKRAYRAMMAISLAASTFVLFTPATVFVYIELYYQIFLLFLMIYILYVLVIAVIRKRDGALLILIAIAILFLAGINDILFAQYVVSFRQSTIPIAVFIFVLIQSAILSIRFSKAHKQATIDELSNVFNRRGFIEAATRVIENAEVVNARLCVLIIDIDHFKKVNDTYGHDIGDIAIRSVADTCSHSIRQGDVFGRFGGEEFALILPRVDIEKGHEIAERLRLKIETSPIAVADKEIAITVSIGITQWKRGDTIDQSIKYADQALYRAKEEGRNRVIKYQDKFQD